MRKNTLYIYIYIHTYIYIYILKKKKKGIKTEERGGWQKRRKKIKQRDKRRKTKEKEIKKGGCKMREKIKEVWVKNNEKKHRAAEPIFLIYPNAP